MDTNREILNNLIANKFFTIDNFIMEYDKELQKEFKTNYRIKLETENWDHHKVVFFKQRMETYKGSYALEEKVKEELSTLKKRPTNSADHRILKDRYEKYLKTLLSQPTTNQKPELNGVEQNKVNFTNNFDRVDENEIYRYFYDKLVKKKMLTEAELDKFLISAFQEKTPPKKRFKFKKPPTKKKVTRIFYGYFTDTAQRPHGKQGQYASLLGEYFEGYKTSTVKTNFSK
jgi:hypothetical protein